MGRTTLPTQNDATIVDAEGIWDHETKTQKFVKRVTYKFA